MSKQPINDQAEMTFGEHLDEVRKILVRVALIFALLFIVLFSMKGIVLDVVFAPIRETFPTNRLFAWLAQLMNSDALNIHPENVELFNNKMAGQFMLHIKSSIIGAFIIAFPYLIWELWLFVKPALPPHRRRQSIRYVIETPIWFILGLSFGYFVIAPLAVNFLGNYQVSDQISNIIDVSSFMTTVISVSFAAAIAFQLPLLIRLLASIGLVTSDGMRQYRKIAVVALLVFAAVITPPGGGRVSGTGRGREGCRSGKGRAGGTGRKPAGGGDRRGRVGGPRGYICRSRGRGAKRRQRGIVDG